MYLLNLQHILMHLHSNIFKLIHRPEVAMGHEQKIIYILIYLN